MTQCSSCTKYMKKIQKKNNTELRYNVAAETHETNVLKVKGSAVNQSESNLGGFRFCLGEARQPLIPAQLNNPKTQDDPLNGDASSAALRTKGGFFYFFFPERKGCVVEG